MSITTIYKCDKCGNEQDNRDQFWNVEISISAHYYSKQSQKAIDVCRQCLESFGILVRRENKATLPPPPTVEDLIREIIAMVQE